MISALIIDGCWQKLVLNGMKGAVSHAFRISELENLRVNKNCYIGYSYFVQHVFEFVI